jgi:hypothetical protein
MSEAGIQAQILLAIGRMPELMIWRQNVGKFRLDTGRVISFGVAGCPDIIGCYKGRFVGIEVKTPKGRQSDQQINFQAAVERAGGIYILARSVDDAVSALGAIS